MASVVASELGLKIVDQARKKRGWNKDARAWIDAASISRATLKRFWQRKPIRSENFLAICKAVGIDNWEDVAGTYYVIALDQDNPDDASITSNFVGRKEAIADLNALVSQGTKGILINSVIGVGKTKLNFVGREEAIADLDFLVSQGAKAIIICATGSVGKNTLARQYLQQQFDTVIEVIIAIEIQNITSAESLLEELLQQLDEEPGKEFYVSLERFKRKLQSARIGVLVDNLEGLLDSNGKFIEPHRLYVDLFKVLADSTVQSVTLITSHNDHDALERWLLSEASPFFLLQKLTQLPEQEEELTSLDNDSDARERQLARQKTLLGSRDALVVGINRYPFLRNTPISQVAHLTTPASDAEAIAQLLETYGNFRVQRLPVSNIDGKLQVDPNKTVQLEELEAAIANLFHPDSDRTPETALLFFAGHGLRKSIGRLTQGFLATSDASPRKNLWGMSLRDLREILQKSPVQQQVIWLDCDHSGELLNFFEVDIEDDKKPDRCFIVATSNLSKTLLQGLDPKWQPHKQVTSQTLVNFIRQAFKNTPQHPICFSSGNPIILTLEKLITYELWLNVSKNIVPVGGELEVIVYQNLTNADKNNAYLLEITQEEAKGGELNIMLTAPGFQFDGANTASLPIDPNTAQTAQTACFRLTALRFGTATITAELYRGNTFETNLETQVEVAGVDLPPKPIKTQPRPVPQPDFILRVQTAWNETNSTCRFQYQIRSFRLPSLFPGEINYHSESLSSSWIKQMRGLLGSTLENISNALPEDGRSHLTSLGQYLFQHLLPPELQSDFRNLIPRDRTFTLLILADQDASLPWELLHDGQRFLSDRFIIGRWFWELNNTRPHEFPVGAINVAHYADVEQPQLWTALLEPPGANPPLPLLDGVLGNLDSTEAMRGLHLIRYSQSSDVANRRNAPVTLDDTNNAQDIERQMRPAKLNLRRNRPLVSLGYVRRDRPELTTLEQTWASAFIRAGCSAFTGSLWAVDPAVEAAFISGFYNRLWTGDSLGEAFEASRQLARAVAPDSLDWLAYVLFGDPMARPYRPVEGKGYAAIEPIGREIDDPLPPGVPVRFRLSLRRTPPVWHEERVIEVAENLTFENLQAHIKTFGLQVTEDSPISMKLAPTGNYLGWFTLVAPPEMVGNSALVQVFLMDGMQPIHSLMFSLNIENEGS